MWIIEQINTTAFANAFWLFLGIVAGALIQHFLGYLQGRRQARMALQVMQIEIRYNLSEVENFLQHVKRLKERVAAGQIEAQELFLPMHKFDYSSLGPLNNSGYFHILLGPERIKNYLEFYNFFRNDNASFLTEMLRLRHSENQSIDYLDWVEKKAIEASEKMKALEQAKLKFGALQLKTISKK